MVWEERSSVDQIVLMMRINIHIWSWNLWVWLKPWWGGVLKFPFLLFTFYFLLLLFTFYSLLFTLYFSYFPIYCQLYRRQSTYKDKPTFIRMRKLFICYFFLFCYFLFVTFTCGSGSSPVVGWGGVLSRSNGKFKAAPTLPLYHNLSETRAQFVFTN